LVLTAGMGLVALCVFFGVNVGFQLPVDSLFLFAVAAAIAAGLVYYLRYAAQPAPEPTQSRAAVAAQPAPDGSPEPPGKSGRRAS
jgi:hypothetical protein